MLFTLEGNKRAIQKLHRFRGSVQRRFVLKAVGEANKLYLRAAKNAAPKGLTGLFRRSLASVVRRYARNGAYIGLTGQQKDKRFSEKATARASRRAGGRGGLSGSGRVVPIHLVESPTRRHVIEAKNKTGMLAFRAGGGLIVTPRVNHPGTRGTGFLRRSEKQSRAAANAAFRSSLKQQSDAEIAKEAANR